MGYKAERGSTRKEDRQMLRAVVLDMNNYNTENIEGFAEFLESLQDAEIRIIDFSRSTPINTLHDMLEEAGISTGECIAVTDSMGGVRALTEAAVPCIGYQPPRQEGCREAESMSGTAYIIEGFEEIDCSWIRNVYKRSIGEPWVIAETERLLIREMTVSDIEALYGLYEDPETAEYVEGLSEDIKEEKEKMEAYIRNMYGFFEYGLWAVVEKSTGRLIGRAGISNRDTEDGIETELGYMIGEPFRKQGFAYEACRAVIDYAGKSLYMEKLSCRIREDNLPSRKLAKKLGFEIREKAREAERKIFIYEINLESGDV